MFSFIEETGQSYSIVVGELDLQHDICHPLIRKKDPAELVVNGLGFRV